MKKTLSILLLLFAFSIHCNAKVNLRIQLLSQNKRAIKILITATNSSEKDSILFYTPREESICMSLLNIYFIESETGEIHEYDPCTWMTDIDQITLGKYNSVLLMPGESYHLELKMKLKDISPYLRNKRYFIEAELSYQDGNFVSELRHEILKGAIESNKIEVVN